jgi:hypothetical protein
MCGGRFFNITLTNFQTGQSMSDLSQFTESVPTRPLRKEERELICVLLSRVSASAALENTLSASCVTDMDDGGMGSIQFVQPEPRIFGKELAEAEYVDSDGVLVSIALNADSNGQLFELDFWKVDFSPLRRYPKPSDLVAKG